MIGMKQVLANNLALKSHPFTSELAMEGYIADNPSILLLDEKYATKDDAGVEIEGSEIVLNGVSGRIDILASYDIINAKAIVELKNVALKSEHFDQLKSYYDNKDKILLNEDGSKDDETGVNWIGILVGTSFDDAALKQKLDETDMPVAVIVLERYMSQDGASYVFSRVVYSNLAKPQDRDFTKYQFNGNMYGKGRLVEAVILQYIADNKDVTIDQLNNAFPTRLQGSMGCFAELSYALERYDGKKKRYRIDTPVELKGGTQIAICTQWGTHNIDKFIEQAIKLGYSID